MSTSTDETKTIEEMAIEEQKNNERMETQVGRDHDTPNEVPRFKSKSRRICTF